MFKSFIFYMQSLLIFIIFLFFIYYGKNVKNNLVGKVWVLGLGYSAILAARGVVYLPYVDYVTLGIYTFSIDVHTNILIFQFIGLVICILLAILKIIRKQHLRPIKTTSSLLIKFLIKLIDLNSLPFIGVLLSYIHDLYEIQLCILSSAEKEKINDEMYTALKQMRTMIFKLGDSKGKVDLIIDRQGGLQMEELENSNLSDKEFSDLSNRVGIADRVYNTKLDEYKQLSEKDAALNNGIFTKGFEKNYNKIILDYKNLFKFEK